MNIWDHKMLTCLIFIQLPKTLIFLSSNPAEIAEIAHHNSQPLGEEAGDVCGSGATGATGAWQCHNQNQLTSTIQVYITYIYTWLYIYISVYAECKD